MAAPSGITRAAAAPAPTGPAYSYDAATELVTVRWDPKDPADTVTTGYREGSCSGPSTADGPCFVRASGPLLDGNSFTFRLAAGRTFHFRVYAENAAHRTTGSAILTVTT
ncbi:fibronectin type III domain-containing protein [Streptomyces sp. CLV115]|uniref:fibronectin type III domain-containing protein n=1 Tax=Streptomyces sp. CLV115 TaxID=3138502 RepID=UPI00313A9916